MATNDDILQALAAESGPITTAALAGKMGVKVNQITSQLDRLVNTGALTKDESGALLIAQHVKEEITKPTMVSLKATDFDQFMELGRGIGVVGDRIQVTADHVWRGGNFRDLVWVWKAMAEMNIRQDLKEVWWHAWRSYLSMGIPPEIKEEVLASAVTAKEEGTPARKEGRDYIIADDVPVFVGAGLGDFGLQDAKEVIAVKVLKGRFAAPSAAVTTSQASQSEPLSQLLTALQPYIKQDTNMETLKEHLADKIQLLKQEILNGMPQSGGGQQPKPWMEQLTDFLTGIGSLKELGPVLRSILGVPEPGSGSTSPNPSPGALMQALDKDGNPLVMDINSVISWEKFKGEERRADDRQGMIKDTFELVHTELPVWGKALKETAEGYNKRGGGKTPESQATESAFPMDVACPSCQNPIRLEKMPEGDILCPHCQEIVTQREE